MSGHKIQRQQALRPMRHRGRRFHSRFITWAAKKNTKTQGCRLATGQRREDPARGPGRPCGGTGPWTPCRIPTRTPESERHWGNADPRPHRLSTPCPRKIGHGARRFNHDWRRGEAPPRYDQPAARCSGRAQKPEPHQTLCSTKTPFTPSWDRKEILCDRQSQAGWIRHRFPVSFDPGVATAPGRTTYAPAVSWKDTGGRRAKGRQLLPRLRPEGRKGAWAMILCRDSRARHRH